MTFRSVVFSGGSLKCISFLGCIKYLEDHNMLSDTKNLIGTSFGALICFYLALNFKSTEILKLCSHHSKHYPIPNVDDLLNMYKSSGLDNGKYVVSCLKKALMFKHNVEDITFVELAKKCGKNVVVCCTNLSDCSTEYFCVDTHPNMSVIEALRMSISIPMIFTPIIHKGKVYVDGCLFKNFPYDFFTDANPLEDTLGFTITTDEVKQVFQKAPNNVLEFMYMLIMSMYNKMNDKSIVEPSISKNVVIINLQEEDALEFTWSNLSFHASEEQLKGLFDKGYASIQTHLMHWIGHTKDDKYPLNFSSGA